MIKIVRLGSEHIDGMVKIENECFSVPWSRKSLEDLLTCDYAIYFVAVNEDNGDVAGYSGMYVSLDTGSINNIGVLTEYRRQGIGEKLLAHLEDYSKNNGIELLTLEVRSSNLPAIGMYSKHGFVKVGTRKNYYKKPTEDGLLYNKEIACN